MEKVKSITLIVLIILGMTGCSYGADDECIKYHEEKSTCYTYVYQNVGGSSVMTPMPYDCTVKVCDEYMRK